MYTHTQNTHGRMCTDACTHTCFCVNVRDSEEEGVRKEERESKRERERKEEREEERKEEREGGREGGREGERPQCGVRGGW